ncbi:MAG: acetyl-CoA carboxylase carboxyl transferase subunit alpha [Clostridia bacterium]|nr:acetyl-CoA carboxylase carboxyl transferase subunit alpha [Clostridia bacterium]
MDKPQSETTVYEKICSTRKSERSTALDYINAIFTGFTELHGDRCCGDDHAVVGGIGMLCGDPVTVIGIEKGHTAYERMYHDFGCVLPEGYRKALRLMKEAEKFGRPVVCFVDTQGANCGKGAEERGEGCAIAENLYEISGIKTPIISVMTGEGGSGGALALAVADEVWMLENAYYSVISPEACASILFKDAARAPEAAEHLKLTAHDLFGFGVVERIVAEPKDFKDKMQVALFMDGLKKDLHKKIKSLEKLEIDSLLERRYEKYRKIGSGEREEHKRSLFHRG